MKNSALNKPLNRLNSPVPERVYNPLYDGQTRDDSPFQMNGLYLVPIMCLLIYFYLKIDKKEKLEDIPKLSQSEKIRNNRAIFDENDAQIGVLGEINDPHLYNNFDAVPSEYDMNGVKKNSDLMAENNAIKRANFKKKRPVLNALLNGADTLTNKLVFAGSFINKDNAERVLTRLKTIGYDKAEIIMKENLPYKVVVTGFNNHDNSAKAEVRALEKRGIDVYAATKNLAEIYRNLKK